MGKTMELFNLGRYTSNYGIEYPGNILFPKRAVGIHPEEYAGTNFRRG